MKKVTIGGERLGAGKKMKAELHNYERSTHDLSYLWRSTMATGVLTPFMCEVGLPEDTFDIDLQCDIKTHPTVGPLFGSYKVQLDVFEAPVRLYIAALHNNKKGIGMRMKDVKLPQVEVEMTYQGLTNMDDNSQINPSCILSYLNIRGLGRLSGAGSLIRRQYNALPLLTYWDIYGNYYANKQEGIGAGIHRARRQVNQNITSLTMVGADGTTRTISPTAPGTAWHKANNNFTVTQTHTSSATSRPDIILYTNAGAFSLEEIFETTVTISSTVRRYENVRAGAPVFYMINYWQYINPNQIPMEPITVTTFPLENLDQMRDNILAYANNSAPYLIRNQVAAVPYTWSLERTGDYNTCSQNLEGLGLKTYQSDLFNNWLSEEWISGTNGISEITKIDTSGGSFKIDALILAKKVYMMLNRIMVSGGSYNDWIESVWMGDGFNIVESPIYHGGLTKEVEFQEVIANSSFEGEDITQPLGQLGGRGVMGKKHKGGHVTIKPKEPCYIMGIISLTPRLDYSQGNKWDTNLKTMDDFHKPALDEIGFQDLVTDQMAWWDTEVTTTGAVTFRSAGKQPAWVNYMTNVNQVRGNFAITSNEMFMTLNRRYERDTGTGRIKDLTSYIDPQKFNNIFAETAIDAQNFWTQIAVNITARRKMSAKVMPSM